MMNKTLISNANILHPLANEKSLTNEFNYGSNKRFYVAFWSSLHKLSLDETSTKAGRDDDKAGKKRKKFAF